MTKDEFMYDHDQSTINDLLNRHMDFHGLGDKSEEKQKEKAKVSNPREFFL